MGGLIVFALLVGIVSGGAVGLFLHVASRSRRDAEMRAALSFIASRCGYGEGAVFAQAFLDGNALLPSCYPEWPLFRARFIRDLRETEL